MQLVAYGAQDVYLTGQPKVTFFQAVYKRHTNFAMEAIQQTLNGSVGNGNRVSVTIARNGDLVGDMWVTLQPAFTAAGISQPAQSNLVSSNTTIDMNWVAERAINAVELTIGGQRIDKHYQTWFRLYAEVFLGESDKYAYGRLATASNPSYYAGPSAMAGNTAGAIQYVYLPLLFFFNRNPGLYLPLIALQYHEVRMDFDLTSYYSAYFGSNALQVWANYVYLDTEERRRFAQKGHEYLIEQVQHTGGDSLAAGQSETAPVLIRLSFNHPVKEFIWCYQNALTAQTIATGSNYNGMWNFCSNTANVNLTCNVTAFANTVNYLLPHLTGVPHLYSNGIVNSTFAGTGNVFWIEDGASMPGNFEVGPLYQFKVVLNGQDRFAAQNGKYFNAYQPLVYHSGVPYPGIYVYSFALKPEEHQPTGTCNFSRIDNAQVSVALKACSFNVVGTTNSGACTQKLFAINYNILRIQSGMGGLAFSN